MLCYSRFSCASTHTSFHATVGSLPLPHICHATLEKKKRAPICCHLQDDQEDGIDGDDGDDDGHYDDYDDYDDAPA